MDYAPDGSILVYWAAMDSADCSFAGIDARYTLLH